MIVINAEESRHEQAASEMQPMSVDEDMLEKQTQQQQADSDVGKWPTICDLQCFNEVFPVKKFVGKSP